MIVLLLALVGLALGSFVNALVWRMHERAAILEKAEIRAAKKQQAMKLSGHERQNLHELSIWRGRSMCPHCRHQLALKDLVPVFSWLWLRGRCRYCRAKIDDTPLAELLMPLAFVVSYIWWPLPMHGVGLFTLTAWLIFAASFVALTIYDLRWLLLPDKIVYPLMALATSEVLMLATHYHQGWQEIGGAIGGALILGGLFFALYAVSGGTWIGGGDAKLGIVLGLLAGGPMRSVLLLFAASFAGVLFALSLLLVGKAGRRMQIPFGPFLILALAVVQLFGSGLVDWYERLFV